jgi:hypothetical protein
MKIKTLLTIFSIVFFTGCRDRNDPETRAINHMNANSPTFIADTPKGKLYRIDIDMGSAVSGDRIYYFDGTNETININSTIKSGKSSRVQTVVIIDGVEYIRK